MICNFLMVEVYNKALDSTISVDRIIGKHTNHKPGPTVVFFGGIHGNETAGVFALEKVFKSINPKNIQGTMYAISGNLKALNAHQRYLEEDLNRMWHYDTINFENSNNKNLNELEEQQELYQLIHHILESETGPFYFIDLHTTSSQSLPFITINDALINRKFSSLFPVPIVLGIEEYLEGPLLSYINQLGYVSLGFEAGQHDDYESVISSEAFIYLTLFFTGVIEEKTIANYNTHYSGLLKSSNELNDIFEIVHLHRLNNRETFKMKPNYKSFQNINKGEVIASSEGQDIQSSYTAKIFMPLYQNKGKEGFFIIKKIHPFFLSISEILRKIKFDSLLVLFPGISWKDKNEGVLKVNLKVTKFLAKPLFHLLGYRNKQVDATHIYLFNRERTSKTKMYKHLKWYRR